MLLATTSALAPLPRHAWLRRVLQAWLPLGCRPGGIRDPLRRWLAATLAAQAACPVACVPAGAPPAWLPWPWEHRRICPASSLRATAAAASAPHPAAATRADYPTRGPGRRAGRLLLPSWLERCFT